MRHPPGGAAADPQAALRIRTAGWIDTPLGDSAATQFALHDARACADRRLRRFQQRGGTDAAGERTACLLPCSILAEYMTRLVRDVATTAGRAK